LDGDDVDLRGVLAALRAAWWLLLLGLLLGGGIAGAVSVLETPLYTSHLQLFVSTPSSSSTAEAFQGNQLSQQRVTSYARLLTGDELAGRVIDRLDVNLSESELTQRITATAAPDTVLIDVTVADPSAEQAQRIAASIGNEFPGLISELEPPSADGQAPVRVTVSEAADEPTAPSSPKRDRNLVLGAFVGLLAGMALAVVRARLDRTVKDGEKATELTGAPLIGTVVRDEALEKRHIVIGTAASRTAEDYRQLRANLQFLNVDDPPRVIMVSSAVPSEGKTTVVVNLAVALADAGRRVTVIEADLRRPKVTRYMGLVGGVGLTNVLAGTADVTDVAQPYGNLERDGRVAVIGAGPTPPNPGELLASHHMSNLLEKLRAENDYVLVDAPPLLPVADSSGLAVMMDGVLLSVRYGSTTTDQLQQAALTLHRVGARTLGVIMNIVPPKAEMAAGYGYGYDYDSKQSRGKHN
jgi:capsular exopolysaccharide synthesis family protein